MSTSTTDNNNQAVEENIDEKIKREEEKETSYILEATQANDKRVKFLAKQNEYEVAFEDGTTKKFKRYPLSAKKAREIDDLKSAFAESRANKSRSQEQSNTLYDIYKKTAEYCLRMSPDEFDNAIWEDDEDWSKKHVYGLSSILSGCLLRTVHGIAYFHQP